MGNAECAVARASGSVEHYVLRVLRLLLRSTNCDKTKTRKFYNQILFYFYYFKMADHMVTVERECVEIQQDIKRLGEIKDGKYTVKFGILYDDDKVQQYYEALVGTLKAAKKRGIISFESQLLLKGAHDDENIVLLKETS